MTVINSVEIDCIHYERNPIRDAIKNNKPIKKVPGKMTTFPDFIIPSGKFKGQKGSAVKMGDTIRIFYPDGTHEAFVNGKLLPGY